MGSHRSLTLIALSLLALPIRASTQTQLLAHQQQARDIFASLEAAPSVAEVDALLGDQPAAARAAK